MMRRVSIFAFALSLTALAACSSSAQSGEGGEGKAQPTNTVEAAKSYRFTPADITVTAGSTVTWTNTDNFVHNVHLLGSEDMTKRLPVGGTASITFNDKGLIRYECSLHPAQMKGSIQVA